MMNRLDFQELSRYMAGAWNRGSAYSDGWMETWFDELERFDIEVARDAIRRLIKTHERTTTPPLSAVISACKSSQSAAEASRRWVPLPVPREIALASVPDPVDVLVIQDGYEQPATVSRQELQSLIGAPAYSPTLAAKPYTLAWRVEGRTVLVAGDRTDEIALRQAQQEHVNGRGPDPFGLPERPRGVDGVISGLTERMDWL